MKVSKIIYGEDTLIDLTGDNVSADALCAGYTAHGANGELINGNLKAARQITPYYFDLYNGGYVAGDVPSGMWYTNMSGEHGTTHVDVYKVQANHLYFITLGSIVGNRFRIMFTTKDVSKTTITSDNISGIGIIMNNAPSAYQNISYIPSENGYIVIGKSTQSQAGIKTYLFDITASIE